jgi:hypothetical protein
MATRSNACSELTRFWLEARHGFLVSESLPVAVPYGLSDLDFVAIRSTLEPILLPDGTAVGPRLVIETKDEHDFDPTGRQFGKFLRTDTALLGKSGCIPAGTPGSVKFSMLRQAHYDEASKLFGTGEFDRIFVVHAVDSLIPEELRPRLSTHRIFLLTIAEVARDLREWYRNHPRPSGL